MRRWVSGSRIGSRRYPVARKSGIPGRRLVLIPIPEDEDVSRRLLDLGRSGATWRSSRWRRSLGPELGAPTATGGVGTSAKLKDVRRGMQCDAGGGQPRSYILRSARVIGITQAPGEAEEDAREEPTACLLEGCPLHCCASAARVRQVGPRRGGGASRTGKLLLLTFLNKR